MAETTFEERQLTRNLAVLEVAINAALDVALDAFKQGPGPHQWHTLESLMHARQSISARRLDEAREAFDNSFSMPGGK